jgi:hypothetical protein
LAPLSALPALLKVPVFPAPPSLPLAPATPMPPLPLSTIAEIDDEPPAAPPPAAAAAALLRVVLVDGRPYCQYRRDLHPQVLLKPTPTYSIFSNIFYRFYLKDIRL